MADFVKGLAIGSPFGIPGGIRSAASCGLLALGSPLDFGLWSSDYWQSCLTLRSFGPQMINYYATLHHHNVQEHGLDDCVAVAVGSILP